MAGELFANTNGENVVRNLSGNNVIEVCFYRVGDVREGVGRERTSNLRASIGLARVRPRLGGTSQRANSRPQRSETLMRSESKWRGKIAINLPPKAAGNRAFWGILVRRTNSNCSNAVCGE